MNLIELNRIIFFINESLQPSHLLVTKHTCTMLQRLLFWRVCCTKTPNMTKFKHGVAAHNRTALQRKAPLLPWFALIEDAFCVWVGWRPDFSHLVFSTSHTSCLADAAPHYFLCALNTREKHDPDMCHPDICSVTTCLYKSLALFVKVDIGMMPVLIHTLKHIQHDRFSLCDCC